MLGSQDDGNTSVRRNVTGAPWGGVTEFSNAYNWDGRGCSCTAWQAWQMTLLSYTVLATARLPAAHRRPPPGAGTPWRFPRRPAGTVWCARPTPPTTTPEPQPPDDRHRA